MILPRSVIVVEYSQIFLKLMVKTAQSTVEGPGTRIFTDTGTVPSAGLGEGLLMTVEVTLVGVGEKVFVRVKAGVAVPVEEGVEVIEAVAVAVAEDVAVRVAEAVEVAL